MTDLGPETDDRHPADVVTGMVDYVLDLAATWLPSPPMTWTRPGAGCGGRAGWAGPSCPPPRCLRVLPALRCPPAAQAGGLRRL